MWKNAYFSVPLVVLGSLLLGLTYAQTSSESDKTNWQAPIGNRTWSLAASNDRAVLVRVDVPSKADKDKRVKEQLVRLEYAVADFGKPLPAVGLQWTTVGQLYTTAPGDSVTSGILSPAPSSVLTIAVETTMGARSISWMTFDMKKAGQPAAVDQGEGLEGKILELKRKDAPAGFATIQRVDYAGAMEGFFLSDLSQPYLAYGNDGTYLAAEAAYPKEQGRGIWVAQLDTAKRTMKRADLLGKGRCPVLMNVGDQLFCVGLTESQSKKDGATFVGWRCKSAKWETWDVGLRMDIKPIAIDACVADKTIYIAVQASDGRVQIWKTDTAKEPNTWDMILDEKHAQSLGRIHIRASNNILRYFVDDEVASNERVIVARQVTTTVPTTATASSPSSHP